MSDHKLDTCGCCEGENRLTPVDTYNRPGLDALAFRVGTHAAFFETMIADLAREEIVLESIDGDGRKVENRFRPLADLKTRRHDDFSIALLDAWATIADVLTFYQERIANEGYLRTATERRSILELARLVGYELRPGVAASTYLSFIVEQAEQPALIPKGTRAQSIPAPGESMESFETMRDLEARYAYNELKLRLAQPQFLKPPKEEPLPAVLYLPGQRTDLRQSDRLLAVFGTVTDGANGVWPSAWPFLSSLEGNEAQRHFQPTGYFLARIHGTTLLDQPARTAVNLQPGVTEIVEPNSFGSAILLGPMKWLPFAQKRWYLPKPWFQVIGQLRSGGALPSQSPASVIVDAANQDVGFQGAAALDAQFAESIYTALGQEVAPLDDARPALRALVLLRVQARLHGHDAPWRGQTKQTANEDGVFETILSEWPAPAELDLILPPGRLLGLITKLSELEQDLTSGKEIHTAELQTLKEGLQEWESEFPVELFSGELPEPLQALLRHLLEGLRKLIAELSRLAQKWENGESALLDDLRELIAELSELAKECAERRTGYTSEWNRLFGRTDGPPIVTLDRVYEEIEPESLVVLTWQENSEQSEQSEQKQALFRVTRTSVESTSLFNVSATATQLQLEKIKGHSWNPTSMAIIRSTTVYAASEFVRNPVPFRILAEEPVTDAVLQTTYIVQEGDTLAKIAQLHNVPVKVLAAANNIKVESDVTEGQALFIPLELDGIYDGLKPGRWIAITGTRTDIPVVGREVALIRAMEHDFAQVNIGDAETPAFDDLPGDLRHTFVTLATPLNLSYQRDTVRISANVVPATHGETARGVPPREHDVVLGSGDGAQAHQRFPLKLQPGQRLTYLSAPTRDGVESTLKVYVNDVQWRQEQTLLNQGPTDRVYTVQTDDTGQTAVIFGDGDEGARPPTGRENVWARYRMGIGKAGNVKAGQISLLATRPAGVKEVSNWVAATGGTDPESRDQARDSVKFSARTLDRLVGLQDYEDFARTFAGIGKALARYDAAAHGGRGQVTVYVAGQDNIPLEGSDVIANLKTALDQHDGSNVEIEVVVFTPLLITLDATVHIFPDRLWEKVQPAIQLALQERFGFAQRDLGQAVALSEIIDAIQRVAGVAHVQITGLAALTRDDLIGQASDSSINGTGEDVTAAIEDEEDGKAVIRVKAYELAFIDPTVPALIVLKEPDAQTEGEQV